MLRELLYNEKIGISQDEFHRIIPVTNNTENCLAEYRCSDRYPESMNAQCLTFKKILLPIMSDNRIGLKKNVTFRYKNNRIFFFYSDNKDCNTEIAAPDCDYIVSYLSKCISLPTWNDIFILDGFIYTFEFTLKASGLNSFEVSCNLNYSVKGLTDLISLEYVNSPYITANYHLNVTFKNNVYSIFNEYTKGLYSRELYEFVMLFNAQMLLLDQFLVSKFDYYNLKKLLNPHIKLQVEFDSAITQYTLHALTLKTQAVDLKSSLFKNFNFQCPEAEFVKKGDILSSVFFDILLDNINRKYQTHFRLDTLADYKIIGQLLETLTI